MNYGTQHQLQGKWEPLPREKKNDLEVRKHGLEEKNLVVKEEHQQSEIKMNNLKILCKLNEINHKAACEVILLMKERIINNWKNCYT
ncbi:hypothetical protein VP01_1061g3 [Puccinia sorghi]|uniref:No apical meristem-associated C-terminal domain-containing protein n=1 Tax=Puccinia sorghi TaxID=27349 RepID=A0A0L6VTV1_9BASI|nr:hypothetical protein VP01_1061g3 [Puccinia sorghi]